MAEKRKAVEPARRDCEQECSGPDEQPHVLRAGFHLVPRPKTVVRDEVVEGAPRPSAHAQERVRNQGGEEPGEVDAGVGEASAGRRTQRSLRRLSQAAAAAARIGGDVGDAVRRWEYSRIASMHSGGSRLPEHKGRSGQPSPDPVTRTTTTIRR